MHFGRILEGLWDGRISPVATVEHHALCNLIQGMLPVRSVCLSQADAPDDGMIVLGDDSHVAPELPLGDVLAEELDLDVPDQSLVIILPEAVLAERAPGAEISRIVGRVLAQAVALLAERGWLDTEHEIAAVRSLAEIYQNLAGAERLRRLGLQRAPFRAGFSGELHALYGWSILAPAEAEGTAAATLTEKQRAFSAQIEAFDRGGRRIARDDFADLAAHFATSAAYPARAQRIQDGV